MFSSSHMNTSLVNVSDEQTLDSGKNTIRTQPSLAIGSQFLTENSGVPLAQELDSKLVIKHTFLNLVSLDKQELSMATRSRFYTEPALDYASTCESQEADGISTRSSEVDLLSSFNSVESSPYLAASTSPCDTSTSLKYHNQIESQMQCPELSSPVEVRPVAAPLGWVPVIAQPACRNGVFPQVLHQSSANDMLTSETAHGLRAAELELQAAQMRVAALHAELAAHDMLISGVAGNNTALVFQSPSLGMCAATRSMSSNIMAPQQTAQTKLPGNFCLPKAQDDPDSHKTTVMMRHLPNHFTRTLLLSLLDSEGFRGCYDFVYIPVDFAKSRGFGYAFVNLISHKEALRLRQVFDGYVYPMPSGAAASQEETEAGQVQQTCEVSWGHPLQGLVAHIERYRNSPVMHKDVPEEFKPVLLRGGVRVQFPPPTKRIRAPRLKRGSAADIARSPSDAELTPEE